MIVGATFNLKEIESILFSIEWDYEPAIPHTFEILDMASYKIFSYKIEKTLGNKYRIVTI